MCPVESDLIHHTYFLYFGKKNKIKINVSKTYLDKFDDFETETETEQNWLTEMTKIAKNYKISTF